MNHNTIREIDVATVNANRIITQDKVTTKDLTVTGTTSLSSFTPTALTTGTLTVTGETNLSEIKSKLHIHQETGNISTLEIVAPGEQTQHESRLAFNTSYNADAFPNSTKTMIVAKGLTNYSMNDLLFCMNSVTDNNTHVNSSGDVRVKFSNAGEYDFYDPRTETTARDVFRIWKPNLQAGGEMSFKFGHNWGNLNNIQMRMHYLSNNGSTNYGIIGLQNQDKFTMTGDGTSTLHGNVSVTGSLTANGHRVDARPVIKYTRSNQAMPTANQLYKIDWGAVVLSTGAWAHSNNGDITPPHNGLYRLTLVAHMTAGSGNVTLLIGKNTNYEGNAIGPYGANQMYNCSTILDITAPTDRFKFGIMHDGTVGTVFGGHCMIEYLGVDA